MSPQTRSLAFFLTLLVAGTATAAQSGFRTPGISDEELLVRQGSAEPPLVVDVRSPDEFSAGHIPGAVSIPVPLLEKHLAEIKAQKEVVLYCNEGRFTKVAEQTLLKNKLSNLLHLEGGISAWKASGHEVAKGAP
jgi:rhodanese-related sulfurtransferase